MLGHFNRSGGKNILLRSVIKQSDWFRAKQMVNGNYALGNVTMPYLWCLLSKDSDSHTKGVKKKEVRENVSTLSSVDKPYS